MTDRNTTASQCARQNQCVVHGHTLNVAEYQGQRVVSFEMVDAVHERPKGTASRNFRENRSHFQDGTDFVEMTADEIRRHSLTHVFPSRTAKGILLTESGYFMLAKSLTDDVAWKVQRELVQGYFWAKEQQARITIKPPRKRRPALDTTFRRLKNIAAMVGLDTNQQAIAADRGTRHLTGYSPLEAMGLNYLAAPTNDHYLNPTELGKALGGLSARKVNKLLEAKGLQEDKREETPDTPWRLTEEGKAYGRLFDGVRKNGTGSVMTLKWASDVLNLLQDKGAAA